MFRNSRPMNTNLSLNVVDSSDDSLLKELAAVSLRQNVAKKVFQCEDVPNILVNQALSSYPPISDDDVKNDAERLLKIEEESLYFNSFSERDITYPAVNYFVDNHYTHNYYDAVLQNRYHYTRGLYESMDGLSTEHDLKLVYSSKPTNDPETAMDFSSLLSKLSQRNFLHSVPLNYFPEATLTEPREMQNLVLCETPTNSGGNIEPDFLRVEEFYEHMSKINVLPAAEFLRSKLMCDPSQFINQHEFMIGNGLNSKMGNFIFQPYVKLVDQDDRSFKSRKGQDLEPCDINDKTQGSIVEAETLMPAGPILEDIRNEDNPYSAYIFDVVPLSIFNWFMGEALIPWLNQPENEDINVLYKDHGMKLFFKDVKFGMRMVYVSSFGPLVATNSLKTNIIQELKNTFGDEAFKRSKAGLVSRIYSLENRRYQTAEKNGQPYTFPGSDLSIRKIPQLMHELHIPMASYEESLEITRNSVYFKDSDNSRGSKVFDAQEFCYGPVEVPGSVGTFDIRELANKGNEGLLKSLVHIPSNFYFKHFANRAINQIQASPEFRLLFEHVFPIKRYMALAYLYANDTMLENRSGDSNLLAQTKSTIFDIIKSLKASSGNDYTFITESSKNKLEIDLNAERTGTTGKEESLTDQIKMIIFKTLLLLLKGFVEITDPAIITAKSIIDIGKAIYEAVIIAVETGFNAAKQGFQAVIDAANSAKVQLEVSIAVSGPPLEQAYNPLAQALGEKAADAVPNFDVSKEKVTEWEIEVNESFEIPPDLGIEQEQWEDFVELASDLKSTIDELKKVDEELKKAEKDKEDLEKEYEKIMNGEDGKGGIKGEMEKVFGSNFLLPATWAALLPSMTPYGGGIIPPPLFIGPPGTFPGIIYLVLVMSGAYEDLFAEESLNNSSDDPNCDDEL